MQLIRSAILLTLFVGCNLTAVTEPNETEPPRANTIPVIIQFDSSGYLGRNFTGDPVSFKVKYEDSATNVRAVMWMFGDGKDTTVSSDSVHHTFVDGGIFKVEVLLLGETGLDTLGMGTLSIQIDGAPVLDRSLLGCSQIDVTFLSAGSFSGRLSSRSQETYDSVGHIVFSLHFGNMKWNGLHFTASIDSLDKDSLSHTMSCDGTLDSLLSIMHTLIIHQGTSFTHTRGNGEPDYGESTQKELSVDNVRLSESNKDSAIFGGTNSYFPPFCRYVETDYDMFSTESRYFGAVDTVITGFNRSLIVTLTR